MSEKDGLKIGIDFGSCYIKAAKWNKKKNRAKRLYLDKDQEDADCRLANVVLYQLNEDGEIEVVIGDESSCRLDLDNSVMNVKYHLQQNDWKKNIPNLNQDVSAKKVLVDIFKYIKDTIEEQNAGKEISEVVITVPVCFSEIQKREIINAAISVGIPVDDIITEPLAAMFAFAEEFADGESNILIFDFGGATLDLNLIRLKKENENVHVEVLGSEGMLYGGLDINQDIYDNVFLKKYPDLADYINSNQKSNNLKTDFLGCVERIKRNVYRNGSLEWRPYTGDKYAKDIELLPIEFESMLKELRRNKEVINAIDNILEQGSISKNQLTNFIMVGGSSRIEYFSNMVSSYLGIDSMDIDEDDMYSAVSLGAVTYLHYKENSSFSLNNKLAYSIGVMNENDEYELKLVRGARYGHKGRKGKPNDTNGKIILYQSFSDANKEKIQDNKKIIYMGSFDISEFKKTIEKIYVSYRIDKSGQVKLDVFDGSSFVATVDLKME